MEPVPLPTTTPQEPATVADVADALEAVEEALEDIEEAPEAPRAVIWLEYDCNGTPFWLSDLGFSFEGPEGPWDDSATVETPLEAVFQEVCG